MSPPGTAGDRRHPATAPHPELGGFYPSAGARPAFVRALFDRTAAHYDRINAVMSLGSGGWHRRQMLRRAGLRPGDRMLDVATGTGLLAREARRLQGDGGRVVGLDSSAGMLAQARRAGAADGFVLGRAEALPFADASFDFVGIGHALRHVDDLGAAFAECRRVLRPGGRLLVLELARPRRRLPRLLARLYLGHVVPTAVLVATGSAAARTLMSYYWETIDACVPPPTIIAAMRRAGLDDCRHEAEMGILSSYLARCR